MTNLLEKTLLIGFGIFIMIIFFILITPFIERITNFKESDKNDLDNNNNTINIIDHQNHNKIESPNKFFLIDIKKISYSKYDDNPNENYLKPINSYTETFFLKNFLKIFHIKSSIY